MLLGIAGYILVGLLIYMHKDDNKLDTAIEKLHAHNVHVKITHRPDKTHMVEISKSVRSQILHASFAGELLPALGEAYKYVQDNSNEWVDQVYY